MRFRIQEGEFSSVVSHQGRIYAAATRGETTTIQVFCFAKGIFKEKWRLETKFNIIVGSVITLCITGSEIACCSNSDHKIAIYTLAGQLRPVYGSFGSVEAGQMSCPYVSYNDATGNMLIVDHFNHRLQVMDTHGEFSVLSLEPGVLHPRSAVLMDKFIYVTASDKTISKFQQMLPGASDA